LKITAVGIITPVGDGERLRLPAAVSVIGGRPHSSSREPTCTIGGEPLPPVLRILSSANGSFGHNR
jgi:hypothetical protein